MKITKRHINQLMEQRIALDVLGEETKTGWEKSLTGPLKSYDGTDYMGRDYTLFSEEK